MKKIVLILVIGAVVLSSCGTYTGTGAYAGATLGGVFGSAIGGINGGPRGSDVGTLVGMVGGAAVGAAIGAAADEKEAERREAIRQARTSTVTTTTIVPVADVVVDDTVYTGAIVDTTLSGDDRIDLDLEAPTMPIVTTTTYTAERMTIRNVEFVDQNGDGRLNPGENATIVFEVMNNTPYIIYDVTPNVVEVNGNRNILISQGVHVESLSPGQGVRYTAMVKAGRGLRTGRARFHLNVATGSGEAQPYTQELVVTTFR